MEINKKNIKPKYIVIALAVVGCIYLYHSFSKESLKEAAKETAVDLAKDAGRYALNKAKDKYGQMKQNHGGGAVLSEGQDPSEPSKSLDDYVNGEAVVQRNEIVEVEHEKFISGDNIGLTAEQADTMLMNEIKEGDLERVKYLVQSGVKLDFTDDKLCVKGRYHDKENFYQHDMPGDVMALKQMFKHFNPVYMYTTDCGKMFLQEAYKQLEREYSDSEFAFFHPGEVDEGTEARRQEQKVRREIFDFLLSKTPKKDYYQFADAIANSEVPQDVRLQLTKLYVDNVKTMPVSPSRKKFLTIYETAAVELLHESPGNTEWIEIATLYKAPLYTFFVQTTMGTTDWLASGIYHVGSVKNNYEAYSKRQRLSQITLPELNVKTTLSGQYDVTIGNLDESTINAISPRNYTAVKDFSFNDKFVSLYLANRELQMMKLLMDSGKININMQDGDGKSILHHIVDAATERYGPHVDRAAAIMIRHLLNLGVNPNLLDKKGATAHGLLQMKKSEFNKIHSKDTTSIPFREMQNAFTLKTYN